jgi:hypothetical protein
MTPYHYIEEMNDELRQIVAHFNIQPTRWFPPGPMREESTWMYNHKKLENLPPNYPHYNHARAVQEIDPIKLWAKADEVIRSTGFTGDTEDYNGLLCANYEDYICITHPGPEQNLTQDESFRNHCRLICYLQAKYPKAWLANWGLSQWQHHPWGSYDLNGFTLLGHLTEMYDYLCPSCYTKGFDDDIDDWIRPAMEFAQRCSKPIVAYMNPWEWRRRAHGFDNKFYPVDPEKMKRVYDTIMDQENVIGVEMWSYVRHEFIEQGRMSDDITHNYQIDAQHAAALTFLGEQTEI